MFRRTREQIMGGGFLSGFSKSPAKRYESSETPITFKDVAGVDEAKEELQEIMEVLKEPQKFQKPLSCRTVLIRKVPPIRMMIPLILMKEQ